MVELSSKDKTVTVKIKGGWPVGDWVWTWSIDVGQEAYALLLVNNMRERMGYELSRIREDAYNEGWKNAKAKTTKRTWFSRCWKQE